MSDGINNMDSQTRHVYGALVAIRKISRKTLLDHNLPEKVCHDLEHIENLADLAESLLSAPDAELMTLLDKALRDYA